VLFPEIEKHSRDANTGIYVKDHEFMREMEQELKKLTDNYIDDISPIELLHW